MTEKKPTVKKKATVKRKPRAKGKYYINRAELFQDVLDSKKAGKMTDGLAAKLTLLTSKYARSAQYARYTFNDDMQGYANMMLVRTWDSFKPDKSDNPFAFYTQCIKNSFIQYLNKEKKQRNIRDAVLVNNGLSPSYTYQTEYQEQQDAERRERAEEDFDSIDQIDEDIIEPPNIFGDNIEPPSQK